MASTRDTHADVASDPRGAMDAEERWSKAEWEHYELWEKIELKLRRRKWVWISLTAVVFIALSSVPIAMDRWPKWTSLSAARALAQEINRVKKQAAVEHQAFRIRFSGDGRVYYRVERAANCAPVGATDIKTDASSAIVVREGSLLPPRSMDKYLLLNTERARRAGLPEAGGFLTTFCYDPLTGADLASGAGQDGVAGFAIAPEADLSGDGNLTEARLDRVAVLLVHGPSAEISFE